MAYNKRNWKARQGTGLNFFSIDGATPVPIVNQPTTLTEAGDALSAGNLNDWEQRIADGFDSASGELADAVEELESEDTALRSAINANSNRIANLEQKAGDYSIVQYRGTDAVPTGKAKYGLVKSIVGKTRAWNQLVQNGNMESTSGYSINIGSIAVSDNVMTLTGLGSSSYLTGASLDSVVGHKYLVCAEIKYVTGLPTDTPWLGEGGYYGEDFSISAFTVGQWCMVAGIYSKDGTSGNGNFQFYTRSVSSGEVQIRKVFIRDLTTILDEWNPSDITTANIPLMVQRIPDLLKWDDYDAGSMVDTTVTGVEAIGFNRLDGDTVFATEGFSLQSDGSWYMDNLSSLFGVVFWQNEDRYDGIINVTYKYKNLNGTGSAGLRIKVNYSDGTSSSNYPSNTTTYADNQFLSASGKVVVSMEWDFGTSANSTWIKDFCVNYSQPDTTKSPHDGEFYPYQRSTLMLSAPFKGKSAGDVAEVLDVETGKKTRPVGTIADLGTQNWASIDSSSTYSYILINDRKSGAVPFVANFPSTINRGKMNTNNLGFVIYFNAGTFNNVDELKSALSGCSLNYPLATPLSDQQVCDPIPDNTIYTEGGGTIDTIQTQSPVIDNCLDVGYLAV